MNSIKTISKYTILEIYKSKFFIGILLVSLLTLFISYIVSEFAYGAGPRVALDFSFGILSISNLFVSIFLGATLLSKEIENKTIYMMLSRSISRREYITGKLLGLFYVLLVNSLLQGMLGKILFVLLNGKGDELFYWVLGFALFEAIIMLLVAVLFSLLTNITLTIFISIIIFVSGHALNDTVRNIFAKQSSFIQYTLKVASVILPDLNRLNLKDYLLYNQVLENKFILSNGIYFALYSGMLFYLILIVFEKKSLE